MIGLRRQKSSDQVEQAADTRRTGQRQTAERWHATDLARAVGRVALWAFVGLVLVRGVGAILTERPAADASSRNAPGGPTASFPDAEARAFAVRFASMYLEVLPKRPARHQRAVSAYLAQDLSDQTAQLPSHGPGVSVALATVAREVPLGGSRALLTVATTLSTGATRYLSVPVARDRAGGLSVWGLPALVPPPARGTTSPEEPVALSGPDAGPIRDVVGRFLSAYLGARSVATLRYYLAPGTQLTQMPQGLRLLSVEQVSRDPNPGKRTGGIAVLALVRVRDAATGAVYPLAYRLRVVRRDRWYVSAVEGGPSA